MTPLEQIWPDAGSRRWPSGWTVEVVASIDSTNSELLRAPAAPDRSVLIAAFQTAGRGRLDRRWDAPVGANALFSVLFRTVPDPPVALTHRMGLAAAEACDRVAGIRPRLKWPNDLIVDDLKLGGILAQRGAHGAVVGLGLNVGWAPEGATRLGDGIDPLEVVAAVLEAFDELPADISGRYRAELATLGRRVRVELADGQLIGTAIDVGAEGELVVLDECAITHRIDVGDVIHLR